MARFSVFVLGLIVLLCSVCLAVPVETSLSKRGATIPKLSGSAVVFGAGTYPRANKLSDGSIIGVYTAFSGGNNIITTVRSLDGGQSWQSWGVVTQGPSNANDIDNPYVLQLPLGRVLCVFRNHSKDPSTGAYTFFRITTCYSDDMGKTWAYLSQPASDPGPVNGNWEPFLRYDTSRSTLQLYYSRENSASDQDTLERFSSDNGQTWSAAQTISGVGITSRDGMTGVATISGTALMAVFESETNGYFTINAITSPDNGQTWGGRKTIYTPGAPNTSAGAPQIINVGGTLAVSFQTNEDLGASASSNSYPGTTACKLITSGNGGSTWGNKIMVGSVSSVWAGLYDIDGTNFLMMFDNGGAKAQLITLT